MQEFNKMAYDQETVYMWQQVAHNCRVELGQTQQMLHDVQQQLEQQNNHVVNGSEEAAQLRSRVAELEETLVHVENQLAAVRNESNDKGNALEVANSELQRYHSDVTALNFRIAELSDEKNALLRDTAPKPAPLPPMPLQHPSDIAKLKDVAQSRDFLLQNIADSNGVQLQQIIALRESLLACKGPFTVDGAPADKYMHAAAVDKLLDKALTAAEVLQHQICYVSDCLNAQSYAPRQPQTVSDVSAPAPTFAPWEGDAE